METLEFLRGTQRMCNEYNCYDGCPIYGKCVFNGTKVQSSEHLEALVAAVEAWVETHPIKTNAQKFKEVFGFMPAGCQTFYFVEPNGSYSKTINWQDPYKEPEHDG